MLKNTIQSILRALMLFVPVLVSVTSAEAGPRLCARDVGTDGVTTLRFIVATGSDDLRGGIYDNVHVAIQTDRSSDWLPITSRGGLNGGRRWEGWSEHAVDVPLGGGCPLPLDYLRAVRLTTTFRGGLFGDNWNMRSIRVEWIGVSGFPEHSATGLLFDDRRPRRDSYVFRFTGDRQTWVCNFTIRPARCS
jgi:hypothetical protein